MLKSEKHSTELMRKTSLDSSKKSLSKSQIYASKIASSNEEHCELYSNSSTSNDMLRSNFETGECPADMAPSSLQNQPPSSHYELKVPAEVCWPFPALINLWAASLIPRDVPTSAESITNEMTHPNLEQTQSTSRNNCSNEEKCATKVQRKCKLCAKQLNSLTEYKHHEKQHRRCGNKQGANSICLLCSENSGSLIELQLHLKQHFLE